MSLYKLRLIDDKELVDGATVVYQLTDAQSTQTSLDSTLFGANTTFNAGCMICKNSVDECPGHYAVLELPVPLVRCICEKDCITLVQCLCPICSHILLDDDRLAKIRQIDWMYRLKEIKQLVKADLEANIDPFFTCPHCHEQITGPIKKFDLPGYEFVTFFSIKNPTSAEQELLNPIMVYNVLQNFTQLKEIGFSEDFHPKNFMTSYLPIIPGKLRSKSIVTSGAEAASALTTFYTKIITDIIPPLTNLKNEVIDKGFVLIDQSRVQQFQELYLKLVGYYRLITDVGSEKVAPKLMDIFGKNYRINFDQGSCLAMQFKGKQRSIFNKGIINMVSDVSCRVVLGLAVDIPMTNIVVPLKVARKMMIYYPVYKENLLFMKKFVMLMTDKSYYANPYTPKVFGIWRKIFRRFQKFEIGQAQSLAQLLEPGDKLGVTLCNGDFMMSNRHPSIREESCTSLIVSKGELEQLGYPTPICEIKSADFDGDEVQGFLLSSHAVDLECLLLHSSTRQLRSFCESGFSFWYAATHDDDQGIERIRKDMSLNFYNHRKIKPIQALDLVDQYLPKDLNYSTKDVVVKNGIMDRDHTDFKSKEFFKYYASKYGDDKCCQLLDYLIQLGYDLNRVHGATLGFEIKFWGTKEERKRINEKIKQAEVESSNIIKRDGIANFQSMVVFEKIKPEIMKTLIETSRGQNFDRMKYTDKRTAELYAMIFQPAPVSLDEGVVMPTLADGTRTSCCDFRWAINPDAYGYVDRGYADDIPPKTHFFIMEDELKSIFTKTNSVATQGYMTNRMGILFGRAFVDYNGCLVDGNTMISTQYGVCGLDSRLEILLPLVDLNLTHEDFTKKYKADPRLIELHDDIVQTRERYNDISCFFKQSLRDWFIAAIDYNQIFNLCTKGSTPQKEIDQFIKELHEIYLPRALSHSIYRIEENFKHHEYYFRQKLTEVNLDDKTRNEVKIRLQEGFAQAGDPVGMKSALAASAPLTQAALSSIHHTNAGGADVDLVIRPSGMKSFEELMSGKNCGEDKILTIKLKDDSKENCKAFALEQETYYLNEIWCSNAIMISKKISPALVNMYGKKILEVPRHSHYVISTWNMIKVSTSEIHLDEIIEALMDNYDEIVMCLPILKNSSQVAVYIYFKDDLTSNDIFRVVQKWGMNDPKNVIHGGWLRNCFIVQNENKPGHYIIEANESIPDNDALRHIIFDPRVDPTICRTTEPDENIKMFGVFEGGARHLDMLNFTAVNMAETKSALHRVYKTIAYVMLAKGTLTYSETNSIIKDDSSDLLKVMKFQTTTQYLRKYCKDGKLQYTHECVPAMVFGELASQGDGVSRVTLFNE